MMEDATTRAERQRTVRGLLSLLFSLGLTLALVVVSYDVIGQSQKLASLSDQVMSMERRLGSGMLPDNERIWIQQIAARPGNFAWHLRLPSIKAFNICEVVPQIHGQRQLVPMISFDYHESLPQQTIIRLTRTSLKQHGTLYLTAFGNVSTPPEYTPGPVTIPLEPEVFDIQTFQDSEGSFELDEPVPLLQYRVKQQWIDDKLRERAIDAEQAQYLATAHVWYFGTPKAMDNLRKSSDN